MPTLFEKRLLFVTGKGGVGKSTVAIALGLAAARQGLRTVVAELASQERVQRLFERDGHLFREVQLTEGLFTISIDPQHAMDEYLRVKVGAVGHALSSSRLFAAFAMATPGMRELLSIGKVWELAQLERRTRGGAPYDLVIVDAPASGHGLALLRTPRTFASIARVGPIAHQARTIAETIADRSVTGVVAVATAEEMPVNETIELSRDLQDDGIDLDLVIVNGLYPKRFGEDDVDELLTALQRTRSQRSRSALRAALSEHARVHTQQTQRDRLTAEVLGPVAELPYVFAEQIGPEELAVLADALVAQLPSVFEVWGMIDQLLNGKRICICAGSGGVGKTTTSAAVALGMAAQGAKVAVVTIDPANRLADALGLDQLDNEPHRVDAEALAGEMEIEGELWAMMLDPKRTFDELIERLAPDAERAAEIKANRVYRELSSAVSGSQEFTAMAKLYELDQSRSFDLLVLDTPPSRNALEFLEAPRRLNAFLEGRMMNALVRPTGLGMRLLGAGTTPLLGALRRVTGVDLVADLGRFFALLTGMTQGFSQRAAAVQELLCAPTTAFVLVTSAEREPIDEAIWFHRTIAREGFPFAGVVVNRVHHDLLTNRDLLSEREPNHVKRSLSRIMSDDLASRVATNFADYHRLAQRDDHHLSRLEQELEGHPLLLVPQLDEDVHDLEGLLAMRRYLFAAGEERERLIAELVA